MRRNSGSMMRSVEVLGLVALGWWCSPAAMAQEPEPEPPCRPPDLDHVAFLEGEWWVTSRERTGSEEDGWRERSGSSVWSREVRGCVLVEKLSLQGEARGYTELRLLAYDHRAREWNLAVVDSEHGNIVTMVGHAVPNGLQFTGAQTRRGQVLLDRVSLGRVGDDVFEWSVEASFDAGERWMTLLVARYSRRE